MSAGHTAGPWKVFRAANGKLLGIGDAEAAGVTDAYGGLWRSGKEMEANANLIAAAPDLLGVVLDMFENPQFQVAIGGNPHMVDALMERARAALAKAEGRP